jgi:hypothetical protein
MDDKGFYRDEKSVQDLARRELAEHDETLRTLNRAARRKQEAEAKKRSKQAEGS